MKRMKQALVALLCVAASACSHAGNSANTTDNNKVNNNKTENKMEVMHLTKAEFLTKVADFEKNPSSWKYLGDKPAIVDFFATWCGPCRSIGPTLEELAKEYDGKIYVYKVDVDAESDVAAAFGIQSVPSILFIPMNGQPQMAQGAMPKSAFEQAINTVLLTDAK
ncbi:MAG: thioredoxin [Muribaculaceae bacterium]|jgi:thioredoxin|nr:thioredoxin [Muribaculaceae bacterium]